jgi:hypothetical protein
MPRVGGQMNGEQKIYREILNSTYCLGLKSLQERLTLLLIPWSNAEIRCISAARKGHHLEATLAVSVHSLSDSILCCAVHAR